MTWIQGELYGLDVGADDDDGDDGRVEHESYTVDCLVLNTWRGLFHFWTMNATKKLTTTLLNSCCYLLPGYLQLPVMLRASIMFYLSVRADQLQWDGMSSFFTLPIMRADD